MNVSARGIIKPYVTFSWQDDKFLVRVDCEMNHEAWIEISFNTRELALIKFNGRRRGQAGMGESLIVLRDEEDEVYAREILKVPTHWQNDFKRMVNGDQTSEEFDTHFAVHKGMQSAYEAIVKADAGFNKLMEQFLEKTQNGPGASIPGNTVLSPG